ncbi:SDR family oxidoreductase [Herbiconiux sp. KACC 21604]|uniref:SDR family NAD(P)-dependent oxidoreductase n=1 Tax=unclassified Herbiconiux TaxID=2618217 RepID=UPI0014923805|nr:glucose 1-dehydrogenase [Herbiconiux sp. SALV-R1]QJU55645.1 SDR family oxidoreductase [Herbiconiux sp. SALV-R1]WPO86845.1 SDR family oxidoreductase [Herbiconiux sp. KACC 21604]
MTRPAGTGELAGTVSLITGAGAGIGRAAALLFAEEGASVVIADRDADAAEAVANEIAAAGGTAIGLRVDVTDEASVREVVGATVARFGRLDSAFNNAGIAPPGSGVEQIDTADWDLVQGVNLRGVWLCLKYELEQMIPRGRGSIVNNASVAGVVGAPGSAGYSAAKHGVIGLSRTAAAEHGRHGVRVNAIAPGLTGTEMVRRLMADGVIDAATAASRMPLGRIAEPREIAEAALWLASSRSSFVTGSVLAVDGGETAL